MANEVSLSVTLKAAKNSASVSFTGSDTQTMSGNIVYQGVQSIATSSTAITFGNVSGAPLKVSIQNLDATNFVQVDSGTSFDKFPQKVYAGGDVILLSPQTGTIYAKADTAACLIWVTAMSA